MTEALSERATDGERISVIVCAYNSGRYLRTCLDSIANQNYENIEIILIDDGSTDDSGEICDAYARDDHRFRVMHTNNNGPAAARNLGLEAATGSFLFFMDSDDSLDRDALSLLLDSYRRCPADVVVADFRTVKDGRCGPGHKGVFPESRVLSKQAVQEYARCYLRRPNRFTLFAYCWGRLFRASIVRDQRILFNAALHTFEDVAFNFDYLKHAGAVSFLTAAPYNHLVHDHYLSATMTVSDNPQRMFGYTQALGNVARFLRDGAPDAAVRKEVGHAYVSLTIIQFVRICGQINPRNRKQICQVIRATINDARLRGNLRYYTPSPGDSRILPILMKLRLVRPIVWVCRYKAHKRYGRGGAAQ